MYIISERERGVGEEQTPEVDSVYIYTYIVYTYNADDSQAAPRASAELYSAPNGIYIYTYTRTSCVYIIQRKCTTTFYLSFSLSLARSLSFIYTSLTAILRALERECSKKGGKKQGMIAR